MATTGTKQEFYDALSLTEKERLLDRHMPHWNDVFTGGRSWRYNQQHIDDGITRAEAAERKWRELGIEIAEDGSLDAHNLRVNFNGDR